MPHGRGPRWYWRVLTLALVTSTVSVVVGVITGGLYR